MSEPKRIPGRNEPCHCGSGKKYKQCCLEKDEAKLRKEREKAAAKAAKEAAKAAKASKKKAEEEPVEESEKGETAQESRPVPHPPAKLNQPWKRSTAHSNQRMNTHRKVGGGK